MRTWDSEPRAGLGQPGRGRLSLDLLREEKLGPAGEGDPIVYLGNANLFAVAVFSGGVGRDQATHRGAQRSLPEGTKVREWRC